MRDNVAERASGEKSRIKSGWNIVYSLSYWHPVSSIIPPVTILANQSIISRGKILEKIRRMVYRSGVFMDTGNTRLKCLT